MDGCHAPPSPISGFFYWVIAPPPRTGDEKVLPSDTNKYRLHARDDDVPTTEARNLPLSFTVMVPAKIIVSILYLRPPFPFASEKDVKSLTNRPFGHTIFYKVEL